MLAAAAGMIVNVTLGLQSDGSGDAEIVHLA